jgi:hypothetical protein
MEALTHHRTQANYYEAFAMRIKLDINRLLWTGKAPYVRDAQQVGPFGHYRSWLGPRDYFELDSNFLCILYGIADRAQAESIDRFVDAHAGYLLGFGSPTGVPARVVYGDYAPQDYAGKHERLGPGRYQSAYWPTVGVLVALGLAHSGQTAQARTIIQRLSAAFVSQGDIREWYTADGTGEGAPAFGWAARMFVVALYAAYLGLDWYDNLPDQHGVAGIDLHNPLGPGATVVSFHGRVVRVQVQGGGSHVGVEIGGHVRRTPLLPGPLLCAGCVLRVVWGG